MCSDPGLSAALLFLQIVVEFAAVNSEKLNNFDRPIRGRSRRGAGLIQGTNLLGGDVFQYAKAY